MSALKPIALVGVHLAKKGLSGAVACNLKRITRKKGAFSTLRQQYLADFGVQFEIASSSTGKEPCVLAKFEDSSTAMLLDARDLSVIDGDVKKFDRLLRAKMLLFF